MKKILVTGGSGFIGKNFIINHLNSYDNAILNFDKLTYAASTEFFNSDVKLKNYEFVRNSTSIEPKVWVFLYVRICSSSSIFLLLSECKLGISIYCSSIDISAYHTDKERCTSTS